MSSAINILYELMENNGLNPPQWIWDNRLILNSYATESRYGTSLVATKKESLELLEKVRKYFQDVKQQQQQLNPSLIFQKRN